MADVAEAQKVRARNELEKLHQGLAVGIGNKASARAVQDDENADVASSVDVPLAVQMVRDALDALNDLRSLAANQRIELEVNESEMRKLISDLEKSRSRNEELTSEVKALTQTRQELQRSLTEANDERKRLGDSKTKTEESLKSLVEVIVTSFKR